MNFGLVQRAGKQMNEIIVVKQLPEIEERLQEIKEDVTERVNDAMSLVCTKETIQKVKDIRAALRKEFNGWEEKRKEVKRAVMTPYDKFEAVYKDCITDVFKRGDADLKSKIDSLEDEMKAEITAEVRAYFDEYLASKGIDFITFENAEINVTLSASKKSLKEKAKAFIDRVCDDLNLIDTQEHKEEILYEYKRFLNVSLAITTVATRHKALEEERAREAERKAREEAEKAAAEKVATVVETLTPPTVEDEIVAEPILTVKFTVRGTKKQLKAVKEFLINNNYDFD